ncbi:MAG: 4-hydroxy-3-methylbut-2-enyl diphosphate reductase [SAR202 cluster bacterium]|nr:4-hydroxy-3-methylbut-2-enyl diphosphate reductase [SAR202 cluster bacterium]|tara:strand:+ start:562 stop:1497 length:936 start_codon:yes stop_codon:yes gene_type:complete
MKNIQKVFLAEPRGFCAGVVRAVDIAEKALEVFGPPVYVRREIVHNSFVVQGLRDKGVFFVDELDEVPDGSLTIFSAHGVSPEVRSIADKNNLNIIDATCPLVTKVHLEAVKFAREGYSIILVGHDGHDEVIGTIGEAPHATQLVSDLQQAEDVSIPDPDKVAVITQTTLSLDDTTSIIDVLRRRFPNLVVPTKSDICFATQNRQNAVKKMTESVDLILVIGADNSSNSLRLQEVSEEYNCTSYLIDSATKIDSNWFDNAHRVGVTSGASTPDYLVEEVCEYFKQNGVESFEIIRDSTEDVFFPLPRELSI